MMGPLDREMALRRGQRKLDAMKRRTGQLRRRVVVGAIVGFALLWTVVFVQMATGNDPALGTGKATRPAVEKQPASDPERRSFPAGPSPSPPPPPPPREEDEELEAVTTGQS